MKLDNTVVVRNLRTGPTVLDNPDDPRKYFSWGGRGSTDGSDVVTLPYEMTLSNQFKNAERVGVFEIVTEESAQADLDRQVQFQRDREAAKAAKDRASIDHSANRSIQSEKCIGPDARNNGTCGQPVIASPDAPPLCTKHRGLASQYTQTESWENEDKVIKWSRVTIER